MALSIDEARAKVLAAVRPLPSEDVAVEDALGRVLAEDVVAERDVPSFANSAMDGFAVRSGPAGRALRIVGESRAGAPAGVPRRRRRGDPHLDRRRASPTAPTPCCRSSS